MNLAELEKRLWAAARATPPSDAVPYAFEKRIMARLRSTPVLDPWMSWSSALWRAALASVAVALLCGAWAISPLNSNSRNDLEQDIEHTLLASVDEADSNQ